MLLSFYDARLCLFSLLEAVTVCDHTNLGTCRKYHFPLRVYMLACYTVRMLPRVTLFTQFLFLPLLNQHIHHAFKLAETLLSALCLMHSFAGCCAVSAQCYQDMIEHD